MLLDDLRMLTYVNMPIIYQQLFVDYSLGFLHEMMLRASETCLMHVMKVYNMQSNAKDESGYWGRAYFYVGNL